jgi:hypothetical protein
VHTVFLDLLFGFRATDEISEKGYGMWTQPIPYQKRYSLCNPKPSTCGETKQTSAICYQYRYIEPNNHKQGKKWSERQVGVYHAFSVDPSLADAVILLHAMPDSLLQKRLSESCASRPGLCNGKQKATTGLYLHILIISTYVDHWRWYLDEIGTTCGDLVRRSSRKF